MSERVVYGVDLCFQGPSYLVAVGEEGILLQSVIEGTGQEFEHSLRYLYEIYRPTEIYIDQYVLIGYNRLYRIPLKGLPIRIFHSKKFYRDILQMAYKDGLEHGGVQLVPSDFEYAAELAYFAYKYPPVQLSFV